MPVTLWCFGDYHYDRENGLLKRGERLVHLEPREHRLLEFFLDNAGRVLAKDAIVKHVWPETAVSDHSLSEVVSGLRRRLGDDAKNPRYIQTMHRRGFRFIADVRSADGGGRSPAAGVPASDVATGREHRRREVSRRGLLVGALALLAVGSLAAFLVRSSLPDASPSVETSAPERLAVLPFVSLDDDAQLDWLSFGLSELLVTGLSEYPSIAVESGQRAGMSAESAKENGGPGSDWPDEVEITELARALGARRVLAGTFGRADGAIRVESRLYDGATGAPLTSMREEAPSVSDVFMLVQRMSASVASSLGAALAADARLDRGLQDVTTESLEAYRHYAEGIHAQLRYREREAAEHMRRALEIDPEFALAMVKFALLEMSLGRPEKAHDRIKQAYEWRHRLSTRERYYVESSYWLLHSHTEYQRVLEEALARFPEDAHFRTRLAVSLLYTERFPESIFHAEELRRRGWHFAGLTYVLAHLYTQQGDYERGWAALGDYRQRFADGWEGPLKTGLFLTWWGRYREASSWIEDAARIDPQIPWIDYARWEVAVLTLQWDAAEAAAKGMLSSDSRYWRWRGHRALALTHLHLDDPEAARAALALAADDVGEVRGHYYAVTRALEAELWLHGNEAHRALESARAAEEEGEYRLRTGTLQGSFFASLAMARLGRWKEAYEKLEELEAAGTATGLALDSRLVDLLRGKLHLLRDEPESALEALEQAEAALPPRGLKHDHGRRELHLPIWFALNQAHLAAGDADEASKWLRKIAESGYERIEWPLIYRESVSLLGSDGGSEPIPPTDVASGRIQ